jgi:hypothetical protein
MWQARGVSTSPSPKYLFAGDHRLSASSAPRHVLKIFIKSQESHTRQFISVASVRNRMSYRMSHRSRDAKARHSKFHRMRIVPVLKPVSVFLVKPGHLAATLFHIEIRALAHSN